MLDCRDARKSNLRVIQGYALFELALVMPILLLLLLGAIDLSRSLHTYSVLQEASSTALRCLYPTDGDCLRAAPVSAPLYNVSVDRNPPSWTVNLYNYSGVAEWLSKPATLYAGPQRPGYSASFEIKTAPFRSSSAAYGVTISYGYYLMTEAAPVIDTRWNRHHPEMWHRDPGEMEPNGKIYRPWNSVGLDRLRLSTTPNVGEAQEACVRFYVPTLEEQLGKISGAEPKSPCYQLESETVTQVDQGGPGMVTSSDRSFPKLAAIPASCPEKSVAAVHHLTGFSETGSGHLGLELKWRQGSTVETAREWGLVPCPNFAASAADWESSDQGGRSLAVGDSSLIPRGAPYSHVTVPGQYVEFGKYNERSLPRGKNVYLRLKISSRSGTAKWQGENLALYLPTYTFRQGVVDCTTDLAYSGPATAANSSNCEAYDRKYKGIKIPSKAYQTAVLNCAKRVGSIAPIQCLTENEAALTAVQDVCGQSTSVSPAPESSACAGVVRQLTAACPATLELSGGVEACLLVRKACDMPEESAGADLQNCEFAEGLVPVPAAAEFVYVRENCSSPEEPGPDQLPLELRSIENLSWRIVRQLPPQPFYTGETSPAEYRAAHPEYDCSAIGSTRELFSYTDEEPAESAAELQHSVLNGMLPQLCDLEDVHRAALAKGLDPKAYFVPLVKLAKTIEVQERPSSACYRGKPNYDYSTARWELISQGPIAASEIPAECKSGVWRCKIDLAPSQDAGGGTLTVDSARVVEAAYGAIRAAIPTANLNCDGVDCARIRVAGSAVQGDFIVNTSFQLPMLLKGGQPITLSYTAKQSWEGQYVR